MTFKPSNVLHSGQGFLLPNLIAIGDFPAIWSLADSSSGWPLHDLGPQQCTMLWWGVILTKFGSHRAFLRQIDPVWLLTPGGVVLKICPQTPTPHAKFQLDTSKHDETHSQTIHTHRLHYFSSIIVTHMARCLNISFVQAIRKWEDLSLPKVQESQRGKGKDHSESDFNKRWWSHTFIFHT